MSFNPDTVPSSVVKRGDVFGAKCPITHVEFLNLTAVGDPPREQVDPSKTMDELVAAQKRHTAETIYNMDGGSVGQHVPRNLSVDDRRRLWLSEQA